MLRFLHEQFPFQQLGFLVSITPTSFYFVAFSLAKASKLIFSRKCDHSSLDIIFLTGKNFYVKWSWTLFGEKWIFIGLASISSLKTLGKKKNVGAVDVFNHFSQEEKDWVYEKLVRGVLPFTVLCINKSQEVLVAHWTKQSATRIRACPH